MEKIVDSCQVNKSFKPMKWVPKSHEPKKFKTCWSQCCLEATMGQWWQWPVVPLGSSLLIVSVYCGLLILSHNPVGIWGVSNVHTVLIVSTQSHPRHSSTCPPPTIMSTPHPILFSFFVTHCLMHVAKASVGWRMKQLHPVQKAAHSCPPHLHLSTPFVGFKQSLQGGFNIYLLGAEWVMLKHPCSSEPTWF